MTTLTMKVTTQYGSHPLTGRGQIKARAKAKGMKATVRTVGYDHGKSIDLNHMDAGYAAAVALVANNGVRQTRAISRQRDSHDSGRQTWTYTVEY